MFFRAAKISRLKFTRFYNQLKKPDPLIREINPRFKPPPPRNRWTVRNVVGNIVIGIISFLSGIGLCYPVFRDEVFPYIRKTFNDLITSSK